MSLLADKTIRELCTPPYRAFCFSVSARECTFKDVGGSFFKDNNRLFHVENLSPTDKLEYLNKEPQPSADGAGSVTTRNFDILSKDFGDQPDGNGHPMIEPFVDHLVRQNEQGEKIISYGLTSYGYDVRLKSSEIKLFTNVNSAIVDPMDPDDACYLDAKIHTNKKGHRYFILPPNSYALGVTEEYFRMPENVSAIVLGKSTYARSCAIVNATPVEAGFEGEVVIEIGNGSNLPIKIYLESGIAQFQFLHGDRPCENSYRVGSRKYQGQRGITTSKV